MAKITASRVREIIETDMADTEVGAFIDGAYWFLGEVFSNVDSLEELQRWVAAHMIAATRERQAKQEKAGPASATYMGYGEGANLASTTYGQMALTMDTTGKLAEASTKRTAKVKAVPTRDRTDWPYYNW
jgi:cyclophilin family peptidyl-prolyl cis-trans isomerase